MTSILCLAHYCDVHGPTPLMVTEGLPVPCSACYEEGALSYNKNDHLRSTISGAPSTQTTVVITEALRKISLSGGQRSSSGAISELDISQQHTALRKSPRAGTPNSSLETPPESPHRYPDAQHYNASAPSTGQPSRDSSFRKTYDDYVTKRAIPCDNCALTLPPRQDSPGNEERGINSASGDGRGPTLRTRAPCARVFNDATGDDSPSTHSQAASSSDTDGEEPIKPKYSHRRTGTITSTTSRSSASSTMQLNSHLHYLEYTSTHEPIVPQSFSIVRASCLRSLSFETLPRQSATSPTSSNSGAFSPAPNMSSQTPAFITTHSAGSAGSGGPIFFGDPMAGYTTAYIFRIPDVHARGHKRVYAFLALSTHRERLAMKTFGFIAAAFRDLAAWVQDLADAEAERAAAGSTRSPVIVSNPVFGLGIQQPPPPPQPQQQQQQQQPQVAAPPSTQERGGGSSFLTGAGGFTRRMGSGLAGGSSIALKQRGLAELAGLPDFFIELHSRFVRLLLEISIVMNS